MKVKEQLTENLLVRVPAGTKILLKERANQKKITVSELVRRLLDV